MEKDISKSRSINQFFRIATIFPVDYFVLFFAISFVLVIVSSQTGDPTYLYLMIGFTVLMLILYIAYANYTTGKFQTLIVHGLYDVTAYNFKNISDNNNSLELYPNNTYRELIRASGRAADHPPEGLPRIAPVRKSGYANR